MQEREREKMQQTIACNLCVDERLQTRRHKDPEKTVIYMLTFNDKYASIYRRRKRHGLLMINRETARLICSDSSSPLDIVTHLIWEQGRTPSHGGLSCGRRRRRVREQLPCFCDSFSGFFQA